MKHLFPCLLVVLAACQTPEAPPPMVVAPRLLEREVGPRPQPQTWLLVGSGPVYLVPLADDGGPPRDQAVLEVELRKARTDALATYADDRRVTGEPTYTLETEPLVETELFAHVGSLPRRTAFAATLIRGQKGRGGQAFLADVGVRVKKVLLARRVPEWRSLFPAPLGYFLFGTGKELYALHVRQDRTGFEQLASVRISEGILTGAEAETVRQGTLASFPGRTDTDDAALAPTGPADGLVRLGGRETRSVTVETLRLVY